LTKPWDPDELLAVLHQACEHHDQLAEHRRLLVDMREHLARSPDANGDLLARLDRALGDGNNPV
jgi:hypothetical protein